MLKTIMGLLDADSGYTERFGQPIDKVRERVSYVPQRESVDWDFPEDVMDVVLMGRPSRLQGSPNPHFHAVAHNLRVHALCLVVVRRSLYTHCLHQGVP